MRRIRLSTLMLLVVIAALSLALVVQYRYLAEKERTIRHLRLEQDLLNEQIKTSNTMFRNDLEAQEKLIQSLLEKQAAGAGR